MGTLAPGDEHEEMFSIPEATWDLRARTVLLQSDPVGAVSRKKHLTEATRLYIHPRIAHVDAGAIGMLKDVEGVTSTNLSSSDVSFTRCANPHPWRRSPSGALAHHRAYRQAHGAPVRRTMRAHLVLMLSTIESDYETQMTSSSPCPSGFTGGIGCATRLATSANGCPVAGSSTEKRLLPATHCPLMRPSVLSRLGSFNE